ncbi:MAG TPA: RDD family protein [Thermoanaerobaculia bacterium]|nr:RDD family protein [Thermoanaerobaculia bacterium]
MAEANEPEDGLAAETVLGLDNVPLDLPVAGVGPRVLAAFLDYLLQGVVLVIWFIVAFASFRSLGGGVGFVVIYLVGAFGIDWAYFAGLEVAMNGRTPGKKAIGLRVVTRDGGTAGTSALLTRNLLRSVDVLVGVPIMMIDPLSRRLGDRLANTLVVHDRPGAEELVVRRVPRNWRAEDVALVEALLRRASDLEPARAEAMARQVLERLSRDDPSFLEGQPAGEEPLTALRRAFDVSSV